MDVEHGSFTPLVFTTTVGMRKEYSRYHSRLAELIAAKKGEHYSQTISLIRVILCTPSVGPRLLSRVKRRTVFDYNNCDIEIAVAEGAINIV